METDLHLLAEPALLAGVLVICFVAAIVQFGLGMGFGLTAAPLLAVLDPELVPASTLLIGLATSAAGAVRERHAIVWREVWIAAAGRLAGIAVATFVLVNLADRGLFSLLFGCMIALAVVLSVAGWRAGFSVRSLLAMGAISGLMGTITSVGAPPLAIVYQDRPAAEARPTLAAFFAVGCALSLAGLYAAGWLGLRELTLAALMSPAVVAGYFASLRLKGRLDRRFRPALLAIAGIAAAILIVRGLT